METVLKIKLLQEKIHQNDLDIKNLLKNISNLNDFTSSKLNDLNGQISKKINAIKQDLINVKRLVKTIDDSNLKYNMEKELQCMENQFEINIVVARKAVLLQQKTLNNQTRAKLFEYSNQMRNRSDQSTKINKELLANQADSMTSNLFSISKVLATEVEKSNRTLKALVSSSALVTETSEELKTMSNYIANSKTLLSKFGRREITDKILTFFAFSFFFGCVIYVVFKRLYLR